MRAWSGHRNGAAKTVNGMWRAFKARKVEQAQDALRGVTLSANWLIADRGGNIGFQQTGVLPRRKHSGLYPVPAWDAANRWDGFVSGAELASCTNPEEGFLVTANQDVNQPDKPLSINMPMGPYRAERITQLLKDKKTHGVDDMKRMQADLHSLQAERFMELLREAVPDTPAGRILLEWNFCYEPDSRGAYVFEVNH